MSIWRGLISDGMSIKIGETAPAARGRGDGIPTSACGLPRNDRVSAPAGAETGNADREPVTAILGAGSE